MYTICRQTAPGALMRNTAGRRRSDQYGNGNTSDNYDSDNYNSDGDDGMMQQQQQQQQQQYDQSNAMKTSSKSGNSSKSSSKSKAVIPFAAPYSGDIGVPAVYGYWPCRDDFEIEYDNDAEKVNTLHTSYTYIVHTTVYI
jgi:hypothetical protein